MKIALGNDHSIIHLKQQVLDHLVNLGHEVIDCGTSSGESTHYPIYGMEVGKLVSTKKVQFGIVICGTGIGITNAAAKVEKVRAVLSLTPSIIEKARKEHNVNVLGLGGRVAGIGLLTHCIDTFLNTQPNKETIKKDEIDLMDNELKTSLSKEAKG